MKALAITVVLGLLLVSCAIKQPRHPVIILDKQTNLTVITSDPERIKTIEERNRIFESKD